MSTPAKLTAEAIGTFALCFIGAGAICMTTKMGATGAGLLGVAIAHGIILSIAVSATMNVSGGHVNPAVTMAMLVTGRISLADAIGYIVAQCVGATVAGFLVLTIFKGMSAPDGTSVIVAAQLGTPNFNPQSISTGTAILIEAVLTFLLVFAVFGTAADPRAPKIGGFGIGLTICADILVGGPLTGAAMNPARTFGPGLVASMNNCLDSFWGQHMVYWVGPILGAVVAGLIYDNLIMDKKAK
ncbi:MAG: aquaporin [Planctomycetes bacterium]|nr:aquaporin [Planctomycetota bacterium]